MNIYISQKITFLILLSAKIEQLFSFLPSYVDTGGVHDCGFCGVPHMWTLSVHICGLSTFVVT